MTSSLPVECTLIDMNIYFGKNDAKNSIYLVYYPDSSPFPPEPHAGHSSGFCSDTYNKYKQLCRIPLVMPQFRPCVYCGTTYCNSFKLYRHCLNIYLGFSAVYCVVTVNNGLIPNHALRNIVKLKVTKPW